MRTNDRTNVAPMLLALTTLVAVGGIAAEEPRPDSPERRAVAYLAREVPNWFAENRCFSCHNNGDAARALYLAKQLGYAVPDSALEDTSRFLAEPDKWDRSGPEGPFSDKRLARLQFTAALDAAVRSERVRDLGVLLRAVEAMARQQDRDGAWTCDSVESIGSPATYGVPLATALMLQTLRSTDRERFRDSIERAKQWFEKLAVRNTLDAAAVLMVRGTDDGASRESGSDLAMLAQQRQALGLVRQGESPEGGWGPFVTAPAEPFDSAVVLLALWRHKDEPGVAAMIARGRRYLIATQLADGSWPETTRPPGAVSYAQRISTTGWATQALLTTKETP